MNFIIVEYGTAAYETTLQLRFDVLRKPLGLVFTEKDIAEEANQIHIAYFEEEELIACLVLVLKEEDRVAKMRQVAVVEERRRQGIGQQMIKFTEDWLRKQEYTLLYCHARAEASEFYKKINYHIVGEQFEEVSILHWRMEKEL